MWPIRSPTEQRVSNNTNFLNEFVVFQSPALRAGTPPDPALLEKLHQTLKTFNTLLQGKDYAAGSSPTIADHSLAASVSSMEASGYHFML